jgi:novobiocin biosynthesis protein NovU
VTDFKEAFLIRNACRSCGSNSLTYPIEFENLPVAGTYLTAQEIGSEPTLPMSVGICNSCGLVQLKEVISPSIYSSYQFVGSVSEGYRNHLQALSTDLVERWGMRGKRVVEIGASDGYLLRTIRDKGQNDAFGYEPSNALRSLCDEAGLDVTGSFFGPQTVHELPFAEADSVIVRHVLEHIDDLDGFVGAAEKIISPDGLLVIEVPDLDSILRKDHYFHFYHEHLTYFTLGTLSSLVRRYGFIIKEHKVVDIHGGSLLVFCTRGREQHATVHQSSTTPVDRFMTFASSMDSYIDSLKEFVAETNETGSPMSGYGAGELATNACGMAGLGTDQINYLVDKNERLRGYYTPGSHLLIDTPERLRSGDTEILLLFASSHEREVMQEQSVWSSNGGRFVSLHPTLRFIE